MSVDCYFEGGPRDGQANAQPDAPPTLLFKVPKKDLDIFGGPGAPAWADTPIKIETFTYYREHAPHRSGCVTYFFDQDERQRAYYDDTLEVVGDVPTGMVSPCQSAP